MDLETRPLAFFTKERIDTIGNNCSQKTGFSTPAKEGIFSAAVRLDLPHLQPQCTLIYTSSTCSYDLSSPNLSNDDSDAQNITHISNSFKKNPMLSQAYEPIVRKQVRIEIIQHNESQLNLQKKDQDLCQTIEFENMPTSLSTKTHLPEDFVEDDTCDSPSSRDCSLSERHYISHEICRMGHELKNERSENCKTCSKRLISLKKFAAKHKGQLISQSYVETITFECDKKHTWTCSYKSARKRWCPHCRKDEKVQRMNLKEQMLKEREHQNKVLQEELFAKAKLQAQKENPKQNEPPRPREGRPSPFLIQARHNLLLIETQTDQYAKLFAGEFIKKNSSAMVCTFDQAFIVYKHLFVADNYFNLLAAVKNQDEIKAFYRSTLRLLHPDKNSHPDSAKTFQKVHGHYKICMDKQQTK